MLRIKNAPQEFVNQCSALLFMKKSVRAAAYVPKTDPVGCITGSKGEPYKIDQDKCIKCGTCMEKCPFKAIFKNA